MKSLNIAKLEGQTKLQTSFNKAWMMKDLFFSCIMIIIIIIIIDFFSSLYMLYRKLPWDSYLTLDVWVFHFV
jgi:hypothetical protein